MNNQSINNLNIHLDFKKVFYKNEGSELNGKNRFNFWILFSILTITFLAIGFAAGSLDYLKRKMDDPYINFFKADLKPPSNNKGNEIAADLNSDEEAKEKYKYNLALPYYRMLLSFKTVPDFSTKLISGRSIDVRNPLLNDFFSKRNFIKGRPFKDKEDLGIIVTPEFLDYFGYTEKDLFVYLAEDIDNNKYVPLPIVAIVKELPDMSKFAVTNHFAVQKKFPARDGNPFSSVHTSGICYYYDATTEEAQELKTEINDYMNTHFADLGPWVEIMENIETYRPGTEINITFMEDLELDELDNLSDSILNSDEISSYNKNLTRIYDILTKPANNLNHDHIGVHFEDLEFVGDFRDYLFEKWNVSVDIAQIEEKENYNYVSKLTLIISFILILFSILIISMFISNVLSRHLDKIKMNIGTFKAFGLKRYDLVSIYIYLILRFAVLSMVLAFAVSLAFGEIGGVRFILKLLGSNIEQGEKYFDLFNWWSILTTGLVLAVTTIVSYLTSMKIVKQTPGDLIYNRI